MDSAEKFNSNQTLLHFMNSLLPFILWLDWQSSTISSCGPDSAPLHGLADSYSTSNIIYVITVIISFEVFLQPFVIVFLLLCLLLAARIGLLFQRRPRPGQATTETLQKQWAECCSHGDAIKVGYPTPTRPMPQAFTWAPHSLPAPNQLFWGLFYGITLLKANILCYSLRSQES